MEHKVIITNSQDDIQSLLDKGWKVISVTAQYVAAVAGGYTYSTGTFYGKFCFVLEREV